MIADGIGPSRPILGANPSRKGAAVLAAIGFCTCLVLGLESCHDPIGKARADRFPESLDHFLLISSGSHTGVRFSRAGRVSGSDAQSSTLEFGAVRSPLERVQLAAQVERDLDRLADLEGLHPLGVFRALQGDFDQAILQLDGAVLHKPGRVDVLVDRAAVHLLRHEESGKPRDLFQALHDATDALRFDPQDASAAFNRAEALTRLSFIRRGMSAWETFFELEREGDWAEIADLRASSLTTESIEIRWNQAWKSVQADWSGQRTVPGEPVSEFPHRVRMRILKETLPGWAHAWRAGDLDAATDWLDLARVLAERLVLVAEDHLLLDTVFVIDRLIIGAETSRIDELAEALLSLASALDAYDKQDHAASRKAFGRAEVVLRRQAVPIWGIAVFYPTALDYREDPVLAVTGFGGLMSELPMARYPHLLGFCEYMLATIETTTGSSEKGLWHYERARIHLDRSAPDIAKTLIYPSLGDARRLLGLTELAWASYLEGVKAASRSADPIRYGVALYTMAEALIEEGEFGTAVEVGEEMVEDAERGDLESVRAEAFLQRGRARIAVGMEQEGTADLETARQIAAAINDLALRDRIAFTVELATAEIETQSAPERALAKFDALLQHRLEKGYLYRLPTVLLARSRAHRALGDDSAREGDLAAAIEHVEQLLAGTEEPANRRAVFKQAGLLCDEMVEFQLDRRASPARAFEFAERGRARELGESMVSVLEGRSFERFRPYGLREIQRQIPENKVILQFAVLEDRLLVWTLTTQRLNLVIKPLTRGQVSLSVDRFVNALDRRAPSSTIQSEAGALFEALLAHSLESLAPGRTLVIVPDRPLDQLPFAALFDRRSGQYLVARHPISIAPSATVYAKMMERDTAHPGASSVLAVGNPRFPARYYPFLQPLPDAESEASLVARSFGKGTLLLARDATLETVVMELPRHRVAYFATHAVVDLDVPERSALILAGDDELSTRLTAEKIRSLDLSGVALVILAVCAPIQGDQDGDEGLTGLVSAFLSAGVPTVIAPDRSVSGEGTKWLRKLTDAVAAGDSVERAFRRAQLGAVDDYNEVDWAAFRLVGATGTL